jgi:hypothetical protein
LSTDQGRQFRQAGRANRLEALGQELTTLMSYEDTMRAGAREYTDVLAALNAAGYPATFTQTGGMCAAIEIQLESGHTILVTDAEDTLAWQRIDHHGWGVGLYPPRRRLG